MWVVIILLILDDESTALRVSMILIKLSFISKSRNYTP